MSRMNLLTKAGSAALIAGLLPLGCSSKSDSYSSCAEAKKAGKTPLHKGDPGYSSKLDRDGDGIACDS